MKLIYFVHDLDDPAVERRLQLFKQEGFNPVILGFRRGSEPVSAVAGFDAVDLGQTVDAQLPRRATSVLTTSLRLHRWRQLLTGAKLFVARNLEMLIIAQCARLRFAPRAALVYESLDVHNLLTGNGIKGRLMRLVEGHLVRRCDLMIVSSPAFVSQHFRKHYGTTIPATLLVENKVLASEMQQPAVADLPTKPPWRIGWFGVIRCRRSLELLTALLRQRPGLVEVAIAGRVAGNVLPDFEEIVAATPGMTFSGGYDRSKDLAAMYGDVHFTWTMDFYEAGLNSAWLLPNRLYEGGAHGSVHLAIAGVQISEWLSTRDIGVVLKEPLQETLAAFFDDLDSASYSQMRAGIASTATGTFISGPGDSQHVAATLKALVPDT